MKKRNLLLVGALALTAANLFAQGPLAPPGPPAPTLKTLQQIEPRTPISSLPVTITNPGSYYLTSNLTGVAGTSGITIRANNVSLDLNGFALMGVVTSSNAIESPPGFNYRNTRIHNGAIRNWAGDGVMLPSTQGSQIDNLRVADSGGVGLRVASFCLVRDCVLVGNSTGIVAGAGALVKDCVASFNGVGIVGEGNTTISGCTVQGNTREGIYGGTTCTVVGCSANGNGSDGIRVLNQCRVSDNHCHANGGTTAGAGIRAFSANAVENNLVSNNGWGIRADGQLNLIVKNKAKLNGTNYFFNGLQTFGPTNNLASSTGLITNVNPWANFSF